MQLLPYIIQYVHYILYTIYYTVLYSHRPYRYYTLKLTYTLIHISSFITAETLLKQFSKEEIGLPQSELTVKTNIQRSIAKRLQGLSMSFRRSQKVYDMLYYMYNCVYAIHHTPCMHAYAPYHDVYV